MSVTYTDLFGNPCEWTSAPSKKKISANGYASQPGGGPAGETCGTCEFKTKVGVNGKRYWKCLKFVSPSRVGTQWQWSGCSSSDIRLKSPACRFWEQALSKTPMKSQNQSLRERGPFEMKEK